MIDIDHVSVVGVPINAVGVLTFDIQTVLVWAVAEAQPCRLEPRKFCCVGFGRPWLRCIRC